MEPSIWVGFFFSVITLLQLVILGENIAVQVKNKTFRDANVLHSHFWKKACGARLCTTRLTSESKMAFMEINSSEGLKVKQFAAISNWGNPFL